MAKLFETASGKKPTSEQVKEMLTDDVNCPHSLPGNRHMKEPRNNVNARWQRRLIFDGSADELDVKAYLESEGMRRHFVIQKMMMQGAGKGSTMVTLFPEPTGCLYLKDS